MISLATILQITAITVATVTAVVVGGWATVSAFLRRADRRGGAR